MLSNRLHKLAAVALFALMLWQIPHRWCARHAEAWFHDTAEGERLARGTRQLSDRLSGTGSFATGSRRFDGEWLYGSAMMAAMGHGQLALRSGEHQKAHRARMDALLERMLAPELRAFDGEAWRGDALAQLDGDQGHAAYLGYTNLALSLRRRLGEGPQAELNDRISRALVRRFEGSASLLIETYPGEIYPVDNAAGIASLALHARATGRALPPVVKRWLNRASERFVDPSTGLLYQAMAPDGRTPVDAPRGSGTALAAYFLSFADPDLSRSLYQAMRRHLTDSVLGFGAVREYPVGLDGRGDIDSGPLIAGFSIAASGFALGAARAHRDIDTFTRLYATAHLFGAPRTGEATQFVSGGALGNAILLAMLSARPTEEHMHLGQSP